MTHGRDREGEKIHWSERFQSPWWLEIESRTFIERRGMFERRSPIETWWMPFVALMVVVSFIDGAANLPQAANKHSKMFWSFAWLKNLEIYFFLRSTRSSRKALNGLIAVHSIENNKRPLSSRSSLEKLFVRWIDYDSLSPFFSCSFSVDWTVLTLVWIKMAKAFTKFVG